MTDPAGRVRQGALWVVLLALLASLFVALAIKAPCVSGDWADGRQYARLCYTDIVPLYGTEQLSGGRLPYLDPCVQVEGANCDEYPVLTMWTMRAAAYPADDPASFFAANAALLAICAALIALWLYLLVGMRALYFALAPTLMLYGFINWDLLAVAFATGATFAFLRRRDTVAGILLGLGAAAKLYPLLLLVPFVVDRLVRGSDEEDEGRDVTGAVRLFAATGASWLVVNLPFALLARDGWSEFFRFNSERLPDWDSLWFLGCHRLTGQLGCPQEVTSGVNLASGLVFIASAAFVWWLKQRRDRRFPVWTLGLPVLILFLLTSKVYSPQFGLWLLPWFALVLPDWRWFAAFSATDVAVFVTRFSFFGEMIGAPGGGLSFGWFELAIALRTLVLLGCVVAWIRRPSGDDALLSLQPERPARAAPTAAPVAAGRVGGDGG